MTDDRAAWEAHRAEQRRRRRRATPAQLLAWLEEAREIARASGALPRTPGRR